MGSSGEAWNKEKEDVMGNRGRFGKYGDIKRVAKLRDARKRPFSSLRPKESNAKERVLSQRKLHKIRGIEVRPGHNEDAEFVRALSERAFEKYGDYGDVIAKWLESGVGEAVVGLREGRACGFAMIGTTAELGALPGRFELLAIGVVESERRKGIASRLLKEVLALAKTRGGKELLLHTGSDNTAAIRLFQKAGFEVIGVKKGFYPRGQDAIVMRIEIL
ncbi:MAG: hypothetical protein DRG71_01485 [Deltaproteobacteria bacterium]|nr:MAG: hypothetical protein DRG71_01485 [Deltaproteobacteria bacterium]